MSCRLLPRRRTLTGKSLVAIFDRPHGAKLSPVVVIPACAIRFIPLGNISTLFAWNRLRLRQAVPCRCGNINSRRAHPTFRSRLCSWHLLLIGDLLNRRVPVLRHWLS